MNPSNGPGVGGPNADYVIGLNTLRNAGVKMLGYVHTLYGERSINDVKTDIDQWASLFNVHGIFIDEVSSAGNDLPYYEELSAYIQAKTWAASSLVRKTYLNFGTSPANVYYNSSALNAVMVVSESDEVAWRSWNSPPAVMGGDKAAFAALIHGSTATVEAMNQTIAEAIARNIGHVYVTDRTLAENPWNGLPTFWSALVAALA